MKSESGIDAKLDLGGKIGEFTVWVDEKQIEIKPKGFLKFPDKDKILAAVKQELS